MESTPEISSALDIYAEETVSQDEAGRCLHIYSENRKVQELLDTLFSTEFSFWNATCMIYDYAVK